MQTKEEFFNLDETSEEDNIKNGCYLEDVKEQEEDHDS